MLVLARGIGQEIVIGPETRLRVVAVVGNRVRLAIDAPPHVRVRRAELPPFARGESESSELVVECDPATGR